MKPDMVVNTNCTIPTMIVAYRGSTNVIPVHLKIFNVLQTMALIPVACRKNIIQIEIESGFKTGKVSSSE